MRSIPKMTTHQKNKTPRNRKRRRGGTLRERERSERKCSKKEKGIVVAIEACLAVRKRAREGEVG